MRINYQPQQVSRIASINSMANMWESSEVQQIWFQLGNWLISGSWTKVVIRHTLGVQVDHRLVIVIVFWKRPWNFSSDLFHQQLPGDYFFQWTSSLPTINHPFSGAKMLVSGRVFPFNGGDSSGCPVVPLRSFHTSPMKEYPISSGWPRVWKLPLWHSIILIGLYGSLCWLKIYCITPM